jgi:protoporphyrinogen oxidase
MKMWVIIIFLLAGDRCFAQTKDSSRHAPDNSVHIYFIISAGETINAYYNDKPVEVETISDFNTYVQAHSKTLKDSWVVVTGKPKTGTFDEVIKTLSHYRFKHVTKNILTN